MTDVAEQVAEAPQSTVIDTDPQASPSLSLIHI